MYDEVVVEVLQASEQLADDTLHLEEDSGGETTQRTRQKGVNYEARRRSGGLAPCPT